jgi:virginiamycin B lyase
VNTSLRFGLVLVAAAVLQGCGGGGARVATTAPPAGHVPTAKSVSPASIPAPPMTTARGSAASMSALRRTSTMFQPAAWTQLPGGAVFSAVAPDGSVWALGLDGPATGDHFIYHYAGGGWTSIPGAASRLAVAPDGTLWAVNTAGGIYAYRNGSWSPLAGGAADISIAADNTVLVISNVPGGPYGNGIWHDTGGAWSQLPGAGVRIAASWDKGTYPGGITPGGWYVLNAQHAIFYYGAGAGNVQLAGAASEVAPTGSGGLFALGVPDANGAAVIYYLDLPTRTWYQKSGAATTVAADGTTVYVTSAGGALYFSPLTAAAAAAPVVGYLPAAYFRGWEVAGDLTATTTGATVVAISTTQVPSYTSVTLSAGSLKFELGSSILSAARRPVARRAAVSTTPQLALGRPAEGPAELAKLVSQLRPAAAGTRAPRDLRRTRSLPTAAGSRANLWVTKFAPGSPNGTDVQVPATLQAVTANGYLWVDDGLNLDSATVAKLASDLDNAYVSDTTHFGTVQFDYSAEALNNPENHPIAYRTCDASGNQLSGIVPIYIVPPDAKVNVFVVNTGNLPPGVGSYFTLRNYEYQSALNCAIGQPNGSGGVETAATILHSNEVPMIYVGWNTNCSTAVEADEDVLRGTAHELEHLISFVHHRILRDAVEETWVNEGLSMLAQDLAVNRKFGLAHDSYDALARAAQYTSAPQNVSLTAFSGIDPGDSAPTYGCARCYGGEYLFQRYLYDRFGGDAYLHAMLGPEAGSSELKAATGVDAGVLLSDFAVALAANGSNATSEPRFSFPSLNLSTSYPDQFGGSHTVGAPATSPLPPTATPYIGSFSYYSVGPEAKNQNLSGADLGNGAFGLQIGVVQR